MKSKGGLGARPGSGNNTSTHMLIARTQSHAYLTAEEAGKCSLAVRVVTK